MMSEQNVELVRSIQPSGADLVELFAEGDELFVGANPGGDSSPFSDDFEVRFIARDPGLGDRRPVASRG